MIKFLKVSNIQLKPNYLFLGVFLDFQENLVLKMKIFGIVFCFYFSNIWKENMKIKNSSFKIFSGLYLELWLRLGAGCLGFNSRACSMCLSI